MLYKNKHLVEELINTKNHLIETHKDYNPIITFGDYTYGMPVIKIWDDKTKVTFGKFCSIADEVSIIAGGEHRSDFVTTYPFNALVKGFEYIEGHPHTKGDITIGNDVWIGSNAKILSGVTIGDGAIVGANSLVTKDVPPYAIVAGNPAKIIKYRFSDEIIKDLLKIKWWDFEEKELVKAIPLLQNNDIKKFIKKYKKNKS